MAGCSIRCWDMGMRDPDQQGTVRLEFGLYLLGIHTRALAPGLQNVTVPQERRARSIGGVSSRVPLVHHFW